MTELEGMFSPEEKRLYTEGFETMRGLLDTRQYDKAETYVERFGSENPNNPAPVLLKMVYLFCRGRELEGLAVGLSIGEKFPKYENLVRESIARNIRNLVQTKLNEAPRY